MSPWLILAKLGRAAYAWVESLLDAVPPYHYARGPLDAKEADQEGRTFIRVGADRIEVDRTTFDTMEIGETLHVRFTRFKKAVSIDRIRLGGDPGNIP